jgi:2-polyprenyl-3-methyl-5-hydroxy-6-metoxy-1,4-benzoquinol methylase
MDQKAVEEQEKYDQVWKEIPSYRECSPGEGFAPLFFEAFQGSIRAGQSLIDFGCGTGRVARDFLAKGLHVTLVDISSYCLDEEVRSMLRLIRGQIEFLPACLWDLPESLKPAHWIFCCDVLEHIPPEQVAKTLGGMAKRMRHGGFLSICMKEDLSGRLIGQPLHLTVKGADWWRAALEEHFQIKKEALIGEDLYYTAQVEKKIT